MEKTKYKEHKSKYNLGDDLWVNDIPRPKKFVPRSVMITSSPSGLVQTLYSEQWHGTLWTSEELLFRTKEELIKSL